MYKDRTGLGKKLSELFNPDTPDDAQMLAKMADVVLDNEFDGYIEAYRFIYSWIAEQERKIK